MKRKQKKKTKKEEAEEEKKKKKKEEEEEEKKKKKQKIEDRRGNPKIFKFKCFRLLTDYLTAILMKYWVCSPKGFPDRSFN
ncbi:hypothetical protein M8J76_003716 [Diaphorina citri]|nr:hypothetical protein M8J76_003716 [Diaphorina citri]